MRRLNRGAGGCPSLIASALLLLAVCAGCREGYEHHLIIRPSRIPGAGNGVFATAPIPSGALLGHYQGKFITGKEHRQLVAQNKWHYVMGLLECAKKQTKGFEFIDGSNGNVFTRLNYAPPAFQNVAFKKICEHPYVLITATKDIYPGDELFVDYGPYYVYDFMVYPEVIDFFRKLCITEKEKGL